MAVLLKTTSGQFSVAFKMARTRYPIHPMATIT